MDALAVYSSARVYGPFGSLQVKRERFEVLRDLYERKHGRFPHINPRWQPVVWSNDLPYSVPLLMGAPAHV